MTEDDLIEMFGLEWGDYVEYLEDRWGCQMSEINIILREGEVIQVDGLPDGWEYTVHDVDQDTGYIDVQGLIDRFGLK